MNRNNSSTSANDENDTQQRRWPQSVSNSDKFELRRRTLLATVGVAGAGAMTVSGTAAAETAPEDGLTTQNDHLEAYANQAGRVSTDGVDQAFEDYGDGDIDVDQLEDVIDAWNEAERVVDYEVRQLGNITEDTTLQRAPDGDPVVYTDSGFTVDVDARLEIEPGVAIEFSEGTGMSVNDDGIIVAQGTEDEPILFTGTNPVRGWWRGVYLQSDAIDNEMDHCIVEYGGNGNNANIDLSSDQFDSAAELTLTNCTLRRSGQYGLTLWADSTSSSIGSLLRDAENNTYSHNRSGPARVRSESAHTLDSSSTFVDNDRSYINVRGENLYEDSTWDNLDVPYRVANGVSTDGYDWEIEAGTTIEFEEDAGVNVGSGSEITWVGDAPETESLSSATDVDGSGSVDLEEEIDPDQDSFEVTITELSVEEFDNPCLTIFKNGEPEETFKPVEEDETVTVTAADVGGYQAGDELMANLYQQDCLEGRLASKATTVGGFPERITLTGTQKERGWWDGVYINSTSTNNVIEWVVIEYGGGSGANLGAGFSGTDDEGRTTLRNSTLRYSGSYGLRLGYDAVSNDPSRIEEAKNNTYTENHTGAARVRTDNVHVLSGTSTFSGNVDDHVYVGGTNVRDRHLDSGEDDLTWDRLDVPYRMSSSTHGIGDGITLTIDPGAELLFEEGGRLRFSGETTAAVLEGTEENPIRFSATEEIPGWWDGISFATSESLLSVMDHCIVEYGGRDRDGNVDVGGEAGSTESASLQQLTNTILRHSAEHGLYVDSRGSVGNNACDTDESGNEFENNAADDCVIE